MKKKKNLKINIKSKSFKIYKENNKFFGKFENNNIDDLQEGEVLVKLKYSSVNYKDFLVSKGLFWGGRKYPIILGIDGSGIVVETNSKEFKKKDKVSIVASDAGSITSGCYAKYIRIKDNWITKLPNNLSLRDSMIFGTAGFTAMYIATQINKEKKKSILITGSNGGVGLFSLYILSKYGHNTSAVARKGKRLLLKMGANKVINFSDFKDKMNLPLHKSEYNCCIDNIGGQTLALILKKIKNNGKVFHVGFIKDNYLANINLTSFILRRTKLIGIHTESLNKKQRFQIWKEIANFIEKNKISKLLYREKKLKDVPKIIKNFDKLNKKGRYLISID